MNKGFLKLLAVAHSQSTETLRAVAMQDLKYKRIAKYILKTRGITV